MDLCKVKELLQKQGDTVVIDDDVRITILRVQGDEVVFAIDAPEWVAIRGKEELTEATVDSYRFVPR
jgi:carbon storage regulator CsrA